MTIKKTVLITIVAFGIVSFQPAPVNAGFFLANMANGVFHSSKMPLVKYGARGKEVVTVQNYLIKHGYMQGKADGIFGKQTLQSVREFQRCQKLAADGVVGEKTFKALKDFKGKSSKKPQPKTQSKSQPGIPVYKQAIPVVATAYTRYDEGCGDYTYRGTYLRRGLVAVDPDVIPLGTRLYIPGYGHALADDIGGAIQGNRVDLAMDTLGEAFAYGVRDVTVYVL